MDFINNCLSGIVELKTWIMKKTVIKTSINYFYKRIFQIIGMKLFHVIVLIVALLHGNCISNSGVCHAHELLPIPDKLVILTFDDGCKSDLRFVMPLLKKYGFGATFFFTDAFLRKESLKGENYMTWEDAHTIYNEGFEIGNHTRTHPDVTRLSESELKTELKYIENRCKEYAIAEPKTFCYPGWNFDLNALQVLRGKGYLFARRGVSPEFQDKGKGARGPVYNPAEDDPLLIPCTGYSGPDWGFEDFLMALKQGGDGKIPVFAFHGIPDHEHPWVNTDTIDFKKYMDYLHDNDYMVVAMRDLVKYVDPSKHPSDPYAPIKSRISSQRINVSELRCEYNDNPVGFDTQHPGFSWTLTSNQREQMQSAYQVLVASSLTELQKDNGDLWNSGKIDSDRSFNIEYQGRPLQSRQVCYWKVRTWDAKGAVSDWSKPSHFEMALLAKSDWNAKWIGLQTDEKISPLLRKEVEITGKVRSARVYISGLGWSELYLNGKKVSDDVLSPALTDYNQEVFYRTYDITSMLEQGTNAIGIILGNGWFSATDIFEELDGWATRPQAILQLTVTFDDGTEKHFFTDETWKAASGPIGSNEKSPGEEYDART